MIGIEELMQIFGHFDGDHNGRIDRGEFKRLMGALGADAPDDELDAGFEAIDEDGNGTIDFHEFKGWWMNR
jgi:Ca2+-binding EF-hand superfamily protein